MEIPDDDGEAPTRFSKPVPGTYLFIVDEAEESEHKDGTPVLKLKCKCVDHPWWLFERLYFTPKARWFSKQKLIGLGVPAGVKRTTPRMFIGTQFRAVCEVEKSKPNREGKVYDNLKVDMSDREGFYCGIQLVHRGQWMPETAGDVPPEPTDPFANTGALDDVPF